MSALHSGLLYFDIPRSVRAQFLYVEKFRGGGPVTLEAISGMVRCACRTKEDDAAVDLTDVRWTENYLGFVQLGCTVLLLRGIGDARSRRA